MDPSRFDALAKAFGAVSSRRGALVALLTGLAAGGVAQLSAGAKSGKGKKGKGKGKGGKDKGKNKKARKRQAGLGAAPPTCFPNTKCALGAEKNVNNCNFEGSAAFTAGRNLFHLNASGANFRGVVASSDFTRANLSHACLVDADFSAATFSSTNTGNAIFCRTKLPGGATDNSGCANGTSCCPTCDATHRCSDGQVCCDGRCVTGNCCTNDQCPTGICCSNTCCLLGTTCQNGQCRCPRRCAGKVCGPDGCGGSCGNCPPNSTCNGDGTACPCTFVTCNGVCCAQGENCVGNVCTPPCSDSNPCGGGQTCCSGVCRNTRTDNANCGTCGHQCPSGQVCTNGFCRPTDCVGLTRLCTIVVGTPCCPQTTCLPTDRLEVTTCQSRCDTDAQCHERFPWEGNDVACRIDFLVCPVPPLKCCLGKECSNNSDCQSGSCCAGHCCLFGQTCVGIFCVEDSVTDPPGLRQCPDPGPNQDLSRCDFRGLDLRGADLRKSDLSGAHFTFAELCGADLRGATLDQTDFSRTRLTRADLRGTDLSTAILTDAVFCRTRLSDNSFDDTDCPPAGSPVCCAENDCITV